MGKKILYITSEHPNSNSVGLWKKVMMQINFFRSEDFIVTYFHLESYNNKLIKFVFKSFPYLSQLKWNKLKNIKIDYDIIYIRYSMGNYQMVKQLKRIKLLNPNIKIIIEIPTYPYKNEINHKFLSLPYIIKDSLATKRFKNLIDIVLTFSNDKKIWDITTINLSNVVDFNKIELIVPTLKGRDINLVAVATFCKWHGYDRLIFGLKNYYDSAAKKNIVIHFVGDGPALAYYKKLVTKYNLQKHIIFYGKQTGEALDKIFNEADIAIDTLGRHRSKVYYNSTLKGKEYGAKGLPIVSGVKTELDYFEEFKYYYRVPADETPINIEKITEYYDCIYQNKNRTEIIEEIRLFNLQHFNIQKVWSPVVEFIKG